MRNRRRIGRITPQDKRLGQLETLQMWMYGLNEVSAKWLIVTYYMHRHMILNIQKATTVKM